jgi:hypothetical protein
MKKYLKLEIKYLKLEIGILVNPYFCTKNHKKKYNFVKLK